MDADAVYPVDAGPAALSEIWAPKLFARGLDTLEVGAGGSVSFTADDAVALTIAVTETAVGSDVVPAANLTFPDGGFRVSAAERPVLSLDTASVPAQVLLSGDELKVKAAGAVELTSSAIYSAGATSADLVGSTISIDAVEDILVTSDGNPTLTVQKDRVIVGGDLQFSGAVSVVGGADQSLRVHDSFVELSASRATEVLGSAAGGRSGILINTVADPSRVQEGGLLDTYLRRFRTPDGNDAFYTGGVFDSVKYGVANKVLHKALAFNVNGGSHIGAARTQAARKLEPYWDVNGGAVRITRVVPNANTKRVSKLSVAMRVTDAGELELVRHSTPLTFADGKFSEGTPSTPLVLTRLGRAPRR